MLEFSCYLWSVQISISYTILEVLADTGSNVNAMKIGKAYVVGFMLRRQIMNIPKAV